MTGAQEERMAFCVEAVQGRPGACGEAGRAGRLCRRGGGLDVRGPRGVAGNGGGVLARVLEGPVADEGGFTVEAGGRGGIGGLDRGGGCGGGRGRRHAYGDAG